MLYKEGGSGAPIVLLHGLMGSAETWRAHIGWFEQFGSVYTFDAAGHGRPILDAVTTEAFVDDLAEHLDVIREPMVLVGHSMGGLHAWCYAATYPDRVRALVVEDMAPDFRGGDAEPWIAVMNQWPQPFPTVESMIEYFGPVAGRYFAASFTRTADGLRLHGEIEAFRRMAEAWGDKHYWAEWDQVRVPVLLFEAEFTVTPSGQILRMAELKDSCTYVFVTGAGHLIHDEQPELYHAEVKKFLSRLATESEQSRGRLLDETVDE